MVSTDCKLECIVEPLHFSLTGIPVTIGSGYLIELKGLYRKMASIKQGDDKKILDTSPFGGFQVFYICLEATQGVISLGESKALQS